MSRAAGPRSPRSRPPVTTCWRPPRAPPSQGSSRSWPAPTRGGGDPAVDVTEAYQYCEQVTSTEARNFSYGIKLLPPPKRRALSAVYAFARRIDDIGDGTLPVADKLTALAEVRTTVAALA